MYTTVQLLEKSFLEDIERDYQQTEDTGKSNNYSKSWASLAEISQLG